MNAEPGIRIGGGVQGQNVVVGGRQTVHGDLTITVGAMPAAPEDVRASIEDLVRRLVASLEDVPQEHSEAVQEVRLAAEDAISEAEREQPDGQRLQTRGNALKRAAESLAVIAPTVLNLAAQVAMTIRTIA